MIAIVTGPPGAGKSYYAVRKLCESLERGKVVATNVTMREDFAAAYANRNLVRWLIPGRRAKLARKWAGSYYMAEEPGDLFRLRLRGAGEGRGVMVLDEAHNWLNSRLWTDADRLDVIRFFTQHRKLGWDVYLISQDIQNLDRQVRSLFEYHVTLRNVKRFKALGIPLFPINLFVAVWSWHAAGSAVVKREVFTLRRAVAGMYDTMGLAAGLDASDPDAIWLPLGSDTDADAGSARGRGRGRLRARRA